METTNQVLDMLRPFRFNVAHFESMNELDLSEEISFDRTSICLVHEDLYHSDIYERLSDKSVSLLLTYGPNYSVEEADGHYRSLLELLPSVLVNSMISYLQRSPREGSATEELDTGIDNSLVSCSNLRILIAEDNVVNQKVLKRILQRLGVSHIDIVNNGKDAVLREATNPFDLVLMDMQMPIMDGVTACKRIATREEGLHPKAKVIFITAHVSENFRASCLENGAAGYLPKPCTVDILKQCLQEHSKTDNA